MSARATRRGVVAAVGALACLDIVLAAAPDHGGRVGHVGPLRVAEAVGGPRYLLLLAGVSLLVALPALRAAKRNAWRVAVLVAALSALGHHLNGLDLVGLAASLATVGLLAVTMRRFPVRADPVGAGRAWALLGLGEAVVLAYAFGGLLLLDAGFRHSPSVFQAGREGLRLLVLLPVASVEPYTRHALWFVDSVRFLSLVVVLVGVGAVLAATVVGPARRETDRHHVERLLQQWATSDLAPFHLLDDKLWFFASDGQAVVSYKLIGPVAVVLGGPVGEPGSRAMVVGEFLEHCDLHGWVPVFHQVSDADRALLEPRALRLLKIGEEAIVPLAAFSLEGHDKKAMRSALRRVERSGHRLEELAQPIDDATMAELREVSDAWLASGGHRERTFTVGRFDPDYLRSTTVVVVRDASDRIQAFVNVLPSYHSDIGNFDLMRRRPDSVNGVMEFLFVGLIERFRGEGRTGMSLGLAPLANIEGDTVVDRALRLIQAYGGAAFSFGGLSTFKARFDPEWQPRYLAYSSRLSLPRIALAVSRAGELAERSAGWRRMVQVARRYPFSTALIGVELWLMTVTSVDTDLERFLLRHFGLSWTSLARFQWWRLVTAALVEPRGGFVWGNVFLVGLVPLVEWRLGSRRTITGFFLGDWLSTVPVLAVLRLAGALGSGAALTAAFKHDAGPSAAAYAVLAAVVVSIPNRRLRVLTLGVVLLSILVPLAVYTRLFDVQHLVAAGVGVVMGRIWAGGVRRRNEEVAAVNPPSASVPV